MGTATANITERTFSTEAGARSARRALINRGMPVSLIAFDPTRNLFAFDVYGA